MLEWGGWGWSVCNGREEMAKARLQLLLLHFISLSQRSIHVDQNHDRTLLSNFGFCWEKKDILKIPFLVSDLKVQQAKKTLHAIACHQAAEMVKVGAAAAQPWSLRQEATLYAGASFDTFTEMCREACLGSHFVRFVTPYMAPLQQHSASTGSTVLYLSSSV